MSKLYFRYGAMNSGKTALLMQVAHNYEEKGMNVKIIKPTVDSKGGARIVSRIGLEREVDYLVNVNDNLRDFLRKASQEKVSCILVDESQFLKPDQVDELYIFTKKYGVPVICYGLRTDFKTKVFPGSLRLFELADEIEELFTICECGKKAKINVRRVNGEYVSTGSQVAIDGEEDVSYVSLCGKCYLEKVLHIDMEREEN